MDAIKPVMPGVDKKVLAETEKAVADYAVQWTGARDHWKPVAIEPCAQPPEPWTVLEGRFVAYPDLIVTAGEQYETLVNDYKTSKWKYDPQVWEYHPELLTQCLAAKQLRPEQMYGIKWIFFSAQGEDQMCGASQ
jgi:predicted RecB family nuclease